MGVNAEGVTIASSGRNREVVVRFSPESVQAPFLLRCGALLIDYLLIIAFPVICLVLGRLSGDDGAKLLSGSWNTTGWLIGLLFAVSNMVVLPVLSGQSIGKIAAGIRIVSIKGEPAMHREMLLRQTLGYLLTFFSFGIGFLTSVFSTKGRALHDFVGGTIVIYADRNIRNTGPAAG